VRDSYKERSALHGQVRESYKERSALHGQNKRKRPLRKGLLFKRNPWLPLWLNTDYCRYDVRVVHGTDAVSYVYKILVEMQLFVIDGFQDEGIDVWCWNKG
jgi:hypothetical protein